MPKRGAESSGLNTISEMLSLRESFMFCFAFITECKAVYAGKILPQDKQKHRLNLKKR